MAANPSMSEVAKAQWLIYGANGYTGEFCAREAVRRGMHPILAGRNRAAIEPLAGDLELEYRVFGLEEAAVVGKHLSDVAAVLHCAGPFSATARPMLEACSRAQTHYLDITGEIDVFEYVHQHTDTWKRAGIVALPGVGFDVVPTDCLAALLHRELPDATRLRLAFKSKRGKMSPGTAKTVVESLAQGCRVRRGGVLVRIPMGSLVDTIPFGDGTSPAVAIAWGDVSTAFYSTRIPNIEVFMGAGQKQIRQMKNMRFLAPLLALGPLQRFMKRQIEKNVHGPTQPERDSDETQLYGEVVNTTGKKVAMTMRTPEGYTFTVDAALRSVEKLLIEPVAPGAQTPSSAFGPEFVLGLNGVTCQPAV